MSSAVNTLQLNLYSEPQPVAPCVFVLFGATGDLAARKIAPALYNLRREGFLSENVAVMGVARRDRSDEQFRDEMAQAIKDHSRSGFDEKLWQEFAPRWAYHVAHSKQTEGYDTLAERLSEFDQKFGTGGSRVYYLATTPDTWPGVVEQLGRVGLNQPAEKGGFTRLIVEKPFGHDLNSARKLNRELMAVFDEKQIFRIDHYLGKETVQNILTMRFANAIFEPLLNCQHVKSVQISAAETVGMEGRRGPYYESVGALRDMVQNHMLQLLALTAMEPPARMSAEAVRNEKVKVLQSLRPIEPEEVDALAVRGHYLGDENGPAYRGEEGVDDASQVETFAALKLRLDNWRWSGVPFYLRTGKRLAGKVTQVIIEFNKEPLRMFQELECDLGGHNLLWLQVAPDEAIRIVFDAKVPGVRMLLRPVKMDFAYESSFGSASPEAYERLVLDAMLGEPTLFIRDDEVEAAWRFIDPVRKRWDAEGTKGLHTYKPGSWGPEEADRLFADPFRRWYNLIS